MKKIAVLVSLVMVAILWSCSGGEKVNLSENNSDDSTEMKAEAQDKEKDLMKVKVVEDENSLSRKVVILADPYEFAEKIDRTVQLIDVRSAEECAEGIIYNAVNIDYNGADFDTQIQTLNKEEVVYIYCQSGNRSGKAAAKMKELGFSKVYDLEGGYGEWKRLGL